MFWEKKRGRYPETYWKASFGPYIIRRVAQFPNPVRYALYIEGHRVQTSSDAQALREAAQTLHEAAR